MALPLADLDTVDWASLAGAYGQSSRLAGDLRGLVDPDEDSFEDALHGLRSHTCHQGDIYEVTPFEIPVVTGVVNDKRSPARGSTAYFLAVVAESASR